MKVCTFFGHRNTNLNAEQLKHLQVIIENLILIKKVRVFLFGTRSNFISNCHKIVSDLKSKYLDIIRVGCPCKHEIFVLENEIEYYNKIYNRVIHENIEILGVEKIVDFKNINKAGKASYIERNYEMIDAADYCVFYYNKNYLPSTRKFSKRDIASYQPRSGTDLAYDYATKKKKEIINVFEWL